MPIRSEILSGLERVANEAFPVAVAWHVLLGFATILLLLGWRPARRSAELLLSLPLLSVSAAALYFGNLFNAGVFGFLAGALILMAERAPLKSVRAESIWSWSPAIGGLCLAIAWAYPHFLQGHAASAYLYGSPLGLLPCPTLLLVVGFALIMDGMNRHMWRAILAGAGLVYGLFGWLYLGVWIDIALVVASVSLGFVVAREAMMDRIPRLQHQPPVYRVSARRAQ